MPDISKVTLPSGNTYDIKDAVARQAIAGGMSKIIAWDGSSTPVVADIPAGITVVYEGTSYTGTLSVDDADVTGFYFVYSNTQEDSHDVYDEYTVVELNASDEDVDSIVYKDTENNDITLKEYSIQYVNNGINVEKVDSSKVGIYYDYYTKLEGNKKFTRVFNVSDTSLPEIVFPTDDTVSVSVSTFDLYNDVECNDNSDICNLKITEGENEFYSALSNKTKGNYVVKYEASDAYGNKTSKNRVIEITE